MFGDVEQKIERRDHYDEGAAAYKAGKEWWENPHVGPTGSKTATQAWLAGWCFAKQCAEKQ